jgi:hypothetical protein
MFQKSIQLLIVTLITFMVSFANAKNPLNHELLAIPSVMLPFLQIEDLQKEIKLSAEQKEKLQPFIIESKDIMKSQSKDIKAQGDVLEGKILKLLLPVQIERLNQFYLQFKGASVLSNPRVQKFIDFTPEQTKNMSRIYDEESLKMMDINRALNNPQERQKKKEIALKQWHAKMMDVLTPEQKKKLDTLKGNKFGFDISKIDI